MNRKELMNQLNNGKKLVELFEFTSGQECDIYKADHFILSDDIIYIPDIYLNEIPIDRILDKKEILWVVSQCYTGFDFLEEADGNQTIAEDLFHFCDWQHPSSAMTDFMTWED